MEYFVSMAYGTFDGGPRAHSLAAKVFLVTRAYERGQHVHLAPPRTSAPTYPLAGGKEGCYPLPKNPTPAVGLRPFGLAPQ